MGRVLWEDKLLSTTTCRNRFCNLRAKVSPDQTRILLLHRRCQSIILQVHLFPLHLHQAERSPNSRSLPSATVYASICCIRNAPRLASVPMSSPSISDDGCCKLRTIFVNPAATMSADVYTSPHTVVASPGHCEIQSSTEFTTSEHLMEDITSSMTPNVKVEKQSMLLPSAKFPSTPKRPSKRLVATPPRRRRQSSGATKKLAKNIVAAIEAAVSREATSEPDNAPIRGRVPKRLKDALALKSGSDAQPQSVEMSHSETRVPTPSEEASTSEKSKTDSTSSSKETTSTKDDTCASKTSTSGRPSAKPRPKKRKASSAARAAAVVPSDPEKIFVCDVLGCEKRFRRSEHLKRHARSLHTLEKPYVCNQPGCRTFPAATISTNISVYTNATPPLESWKFQRRITPSQEISQTMMRILRTTKTTLQQMYRHRRPRLDLPSHLLPPLLPRFHSDRHLHHLSISDPCTAIPVRTPPKKRRSGARERWRRRSEASETVVVHQTTLQRRHSMKTTQIFDYGRYLLDMAGPSCNIFVIKGISFFTSHPGLLSLYCFFSHGVHSPCLRSSIYFFLSACLF